MTVAQIIARLSSFPGEMEVKIPYTCLPRGGFQMCDLEKGFEELTEFDIVDKKLQLS